MPLRILVVEDNPVNERVLVAMLANLGYEADVARNGAVAVEMAAGGPYDVVFMDVVMPIMDGLTATREILRGAHDARPTIVGMTALAEPGDREACLEAGMDAYMAKPVSMEELSAALRSVRQHDKPRFKSRPTRRGA